MELGTVQFRVEVLNQIIQFLQDAPHRYAHPVIETIRAEVARASEKNGDQ